MGFAGQLAALLVMTGAGAATHPNSAPKAGPPKLKETIAALPVNVGDVVDLKHPCGKGYASRRSTVATPFVSGYTCTPRGASGYFSKLAIEVLGRRVLSVWTTLRPAYQWKANNPARLAAYVESFDHADVSWESMSIRADTATLRIVDVGGHEKDGSVFLTGPLVGSILTTVKFAPSDRPPCGGDPQGQFKPPRETEAMFGDYACVTLLTRIARESFGANQWNWPAYDPITQGAIHEVETTARAALDKRIAEAPPEQRAELQAVLNEWLAIATTPKYWNELQENVLSGRLK